MVVQMIRPNAGQLNLDFWTQLIAKFISKNHYGEIVVPITNEALNWFKNSKCGNGIKNFLNRD